MKRFVATLLLVITTCLSSVASAQAPQSPAQAPPFVAGDRVSFLGDSIFHGGKVHSNLLLFYATRFPDSPLAIRNAGVAGDMASGAVTRVDWDVKPYDPTVTVVMFGMNDVGRWLFGEGKDSPANLEARKRMFDTHVQSMAALLDKLNGTKLILCTPTPFDQRTQRPTGNAMGVDDALAAVAENARKLARERGCGLVDFHAQMNRVLREQQAKDPAFTMMDPARIHPDDAGHMLMTYLFLKAQGMTSTVARMAIDAGSVAVVEAQNCELAQLQKRDRGIAFTYLGKSLPFPVEGNAAAALDWVPFMDDLDQEMLVVQNLTAGNYRVSIDGQEIGSWTAADLAKGINLAGNPKTPQYRQAMSMAELNEKRRSRENSTLRVFAALEHDVLRPKGVDPADMAAVKRVMDAAIEEEGRNKTWRHSYFINLSKAYYAEKPRQQQIEQELAAMSAKLFEMARPKSHAMEITQVAPAN